MERITLTTGSSDAYELLDSGHEEKLERYGSIVLARPDPQALWEKEQSPKEWERAHSRYVRARGHSISAGKQGRAGEWKTSKDFPKEWDISFEGLTFTIRATSFKHTGLFPEQAPNWQWIRERVEAAAAQTKTPDKQVTVLNLFGYTGGATLAAAKAGAQVTHVDASKTAVAWARQNAERSGLERAPVRWITEDVMKFVERECKRGNTYDAIIMDPPAFGHGPKDELWKIEEDLLPLLTTCEQLLSQQPLFVLISGYAAGYSSVALGVNLMRFKRRWGGSVAHGDLTIAESSKKEGRMLPCGIFGRWSRV